MSDNILAEMDNIDMLSALQTLIKRSCIIDFGIVKSVRSKGLVDVEVAVSSTKQNIVVVTCVLANISSKALTINVEPSVGDKVMVFYPRTYDNKMFSTTETIVNPRARGYNLLSGIAFLMNQYQTASHKNIFNVSPNGSLSLITKDGDNTIMSLTANSEGMNITDKNGCTIQTSSSGTVINGVLTIKKS